MLSIPVLYEQHKLEYQRDGFVIVRNAFSPGDAEMIANWCEELVALPEEPGKHWVYHEQSALSNEKLISRIENICPYHAGFAELSRVLAVPVSQLLDEKAVLFKEKVNFKMPGGDGFKPHQDSQAGWDSYADYFISAAVCIDESTIENGCLQLVAGHQGDGLYDKWAPLSEEVIAGMNFEFYPMNPGDLVLFDCYTPHASEPNLSNNIRRMFFATYNRLSKGDHLEKYYADKHKNYPPDIEREADREYVFRV